MTVQKIAPYLAAMALLLLLLGACALPPEAATTDATGPAGTDAAAASYCTDNGGLVETRYPFYSTNSASPLQLAGSLAVCTFTADDGSRIIVGLDTLYTDQATLAALAYRAKTPLDTGDAPASANPSSIYCTQLGGTDAFGGVNASGGGWALEGAADPIALCVFPDLSVIDSWGITYHSEGSIRGADLGGLFRFTE